MSQKTDTPYLMSPKIDFAFKLIFGDKKHTDITIAFLSAVLKVAREELAEIEIINSELLREFKEDKKGILDVRVKTRHDQQINIEIQILPTDFIPARILFYWSKMFASQIRAGDTYDKLKKCVNINIVDFNCTPLNQLHSCYHIIEDTSGHRLTELLEVHFMELPKLVSKNIDRNENDPVVQWMMFINSQSQEVMEMLAQKNQDIGKAFNLLQIISQDQHKRMAYEARQAEIMDQRTRILEATRKGEEIGVKRGSEEKTILLAQRMLTRGMPIDEVAAITMLECIEVANIQKALNSETV